MIFIKHHYELLIFVRYHIKNRTLKIVLDKSLCRSEIFLYFPPFVLLGMTQFHVLRTTGRGGKFFGTEVARKFLNSCVNGKVFFKLGSALARLGAHRARVHLDILAVH